MNRIALTLAVIGLTFSAAAQDFNKDIQTARQSYSSGNLENSRFVMQQMLQGIDIISGKETLKLLPTSLDNMTAKISEDAVTAGSGFAGAIIHRLYQFEDKTATLEIISNSPMIGSINAILSIPFIGTGGNGDRMVVKVDGYKALIQKDSEATVPSYTIQVPLGSTLISVKTENFSGDVVKLVNSLPVTQIAQKLN